MSMTTQDMAKYILKMFALCQSKVRKASLNIDIMSNVVIKRDCRAWTFGIANVDYSIVNEIRDLNDNLIFVPFYIDMFNTSVKHSDNVTVFFLDNECLEHLSEVMLSKILNAMSVHGSYVRFKAPEHDELQHKIMACNRHIQELYVKSRQIGKHWQLMNDIAHSMHNYYQLLNKQFVRIEIVPKHFNCVEELCIWLDMQDIE